MSLYSIFSFHSFIPDLPCSLKSSEASFIFFHHLLLSHQPSSLRSFSSALISQALISLQSQSRRRHQPQSQPSPSPAHRRRRRSTVLSQALKPLFFFIISSSHLSASPSPSQPSPLPSPAHAVRAHASAHRRPSPRLSSSPLLAHFRSVLSPIF